MRQHQSFIKCPTSDQPDIVCSLLLTNMGEVLAVGSNSEGQIDASDQTLKFETVKTVIGPSAIFKASIRYSDCLLSPQIWLCVCCFSRGMLSSAFCIYSRWIPNLPNWMRSHWLCDPFWNPSEWSFLVPPVLPWLTKTLFFSRQIACGARHSLAVCNKGHVYCWGWSLHGQCASRESTSTIAVVQPLIGLNVISIAGGLGHSLACTDAGDAFRWFQA